MNNNDWGKIENSQLVLFEGMIKDGNKYIIIPTEADFRKFGWFPIKDEPPPVAPSGYHCEPRGPAQNGDSIVRMTWKIVADPPAPPRRWSRFAIKGAIADAHLLPQVKAFLSAFELKPDYSALEAFTDVDYIEEFYGGEEVWNALLDGLATNLGKTREEIDIFMDGIPTEN